MTTATVVLLRTIETMAMMASNQTQLIQRIRLRSAPNVACHLLTALLHAETTTLTTTTVQRLQLQLCAASERSPSPRHCSNEP